MFNLSRQVLIGRTYNKLPKQPSDKEIFIHICERLFLFFLIIGGDSNQSYFAMIIEALLHDSQNRHASQHTV